ncbi:hypothetical protein [Candidatus Aquiluna sp. UB-MaderosW2red]|nr:hypothetical protein [Candidatus Aquiluna sp. UB-MaderosW2red]
MTRTGCFTIKARTNKHSADWYDNGRYFDDFFKTAIEAANSEDRWSQIR